MERTVWTEDAIRGLGVETNVETAGSIFGLSRTQAYARVKDGTFPVPPVRVAGRLIVPVTPILRLMGMGPATSGENASAAIDPDQLADLVAERVVSRLVAALAGAARADPLPVSAAPARLKSVANAGGADAAA